MSGTDLRFSTAMGAMKLLADQDFAERMRSTGLTQEQYLRVVGAAPWASHERPQVRQTLDALSASVMDMVGVARFEMPAEYIAAVIVSFVHPHNIMTACRWMENQRSGASLAGASSDAEMVDPAQIFVLCCDLYSSDDGSEIRHRFEKKVGYAIRKAKESSDGKKE